MDCHKVKNFFVLSNPFEVVGHIEIWAEGSVILSAKSDVHYTTDDIHSIHTYMTSINEQYLYGENLGLEHEEIIKNIEVG